MPHIIVEYSKDIEKSVDIPNMLSKLHNKLAEQGIYSTRIKSRAIACDHVVVGDKGASGCLMHLTLLILEGRDLATKKNFGDPLYQIMNDYASDNCAATLEIREMNKETYYM